MADKLKHETIPFSYYVFALNPDGTPARYMMGTYDAKRARDAAHDIAQSNAGTTYVVLETASYIVGEPGPVKETRIADGDEGTVQ